MAVLSTVPIVPLFTAHDQPDVAFVTANGIDYRCFVYLDRTSWAVRATCHRTQQDGTHVMVFDNIVARATAGEVSATNGIPLDSPKIIATGTTFVVHWLQATSIPVNERNWALWRATMDMTAFSTTSWTSQGSISILASHILYDVCPLIGHATDFVVTRYTAVGTVTIQRFNGYTWIATAWTATPSLNLAARVLGVYAHSTDDCVVISYERNTAGGTTADLGQLWSSRVTAAAGTGLASVQTMTEFSTAAGETGARWLQVGHCRTSAQRVAVVAEALASANEGAGSTIFGRRWIHHIVYRTINTNSAAQVSNIHWAANLHMCSRPWSYAGGDSTSTPTMEVYCLASYRSCVDAYDRPADGSPTTDSSGGDAWSQSYHYALNLDFRLWDSVDDGAGLRPRVISTMYTVGVPDGRASGWKPQENTTTAVHGAGPTKRMNHLSYASAAPLAGPDIKTRTIATVIYTRASHIAEDQDTGPAHTLFPTIQSHAPEHADIHGTVIYMEDPHTVFRDATDPTQPFDNFRGAYPRYMCQTTPVGRGLIFGGGTPHVYDGQRCVELGYVYNPEIIDWSLATISGSELASMNVGAHQIFAVYTWRDSAGQLHRSGPSNVVTFTAGVGQNICLLRVRCMTISLKDATAHYTDAPGISIELYATAADSTTFFRVFGSDRQETGGATQSYRPRDLPTNDTSTINGGQVIYFGLPDSRLTTHAAAPTEFQYDASNAFNGPLPVPPPAMSVITTYQGRLLGADSLDPAVFWYSDQLLPEPGGEYYTVPEFSSAQYERIGDVGEITSLRALDFQTIAHTRNGIYALAAQGEGSVTGTLSWAIRPLHEGIGCISPRSVVSYPLGLRFQSDKGVYDLARSGEASYGVLARSRDQPQSRAGAALEEKLANAGNILSADHDPTKHQIRYVANDRPAIVQTWTGTVVVGASSSGFWVINGLDQQVTAQLAAGLTAAQVADQLQVAVQALLAAPPPTTLQFQVASVSSPGSTVQIVLLADEKAVPSGVAPNGGSLTFALTESLTATRPRVLVDHYDVQMSTSFDLPQAASTARYSEVVGSCYWYGDTGARHVVQTQGATLIQRLPSETNAWRDEAASGNVAIPLDVTFAWLSLAGLSGAQCWDEIRVQIERLHADEIHVDLRYDDAGRFDGEQYATTTYTWTDLQRGDLPVRPRYRRVRSMRLRVYEGSSITQSYETFRILGLTAYVGVEKGPKRVAPTQRGSV